MSQMTKRALEASLKELLRHKPLDKITVSDLTDHCGVNRMTFYYHFKDIYDLVEWCCEEDAARALAGQKTYDTWQQGFLQILEALRKDKAFFTSVYRSISREQLENYLYRLPVNSSSFRARKPGFLQISMTAWVTSAPGASFQLQTVLTPSSARLRFRPAPA